MRQEGREPTIDNEASGPINDSPSSGRQILRAQGVGLAGARLLVGYQI